METTRIARLEVNKLSFSYDNGISIIKDVSLSLFSGNVYVLLGRMGSGKSTFFKLLARLLKPDCGQILINGIDIWDMEEREFRKKLVMSFQYPDKSIFATTVYDEIVFALRMLYGDQYIDFQSMVKNALDIVGLPTTFLERNPHHLSGGEKRKVALAASIVHRPNIMLLDEPTAGLDSTSSDHILDFISNYAKEGNLVIFTTHNLEEVEVANGVLVMKEGEIFPIDKTAVMDREIVKYDLIPPDVVLYEVWGKYHGYE